MKSIPLHAVPNEGFLPLVVRQWAEPSRRAIFVASDDSMLRGLAAAMPVFLPDRPTHVLPAWGTSPSERARPPRAITGMRVASLVAIAEHPEPCLVLTTPEALLQRIPPAERLLERRVRLLRDRLIDLDWLHATLTAFGYDLVERVDEPGEAVLRPGVVDIFAAGAANPVRLELSNSRIAAMRRFDVTDQLSTGDVPSLLLLPASEGFIVPGEAAELVHPLLPEGGLATLFGLMPGAVLAVTDSFGQRVQDWLDLVRDSYRIAVSAIRAEPPPPHRGGTNLLVPAIEAGRVWRYGAAGTMLPDRLEASAWRDRRAQTERELQATAARLVAQVRERQAQHAPAFEPTEAYRRFVRAMPFAPTPDQAQAIRCVQEDLGGSHPMLRLVCGDVGFGKTDVALHATALAALAGYQVAIAAPTTLLARQHLEVFRRRLARLDLRIEPLIRSSRSAESRQVLQGLGDGAVDVVIGTHAVAAARFKRLGLVIIDEEQRFGEAHKLALRKKREGLHMLIMTATPLPRTLQGALVGVLDVSLLAQPPAARLPVRSIVVPFDPLVVRTALMREARRGGQSFVVCPRIQDLAPMRARLVEIVPELSIAVAHGRLRGEELDRLVLGFGSGEGDVLLTTNIIETGLDIANANTMLIWRAERFGLAQLHQLRGRIGRGRVRASAILMTDGDHPPSATACDGWTRLHHLVG